MSPRQLCIGGRGLGCVKNKFLLRYCPGPACQGTMQKYRQICSATKQPRAPHRRSDRHWQTDRQTDRKREQRDRQTDRPMDRQTDRWTDGQTTATPSGAASPTTHAKQHPAESPLYFDGFSLRLGHCASNQNASVTRGACNDL